MTLDWQRWREPLSLSSLFPCYSLCYSSSSSTKSQGEEWLWKAHQMMWHFESSFFALYFYRSLRLTLDEVSGKRRENMKHSLYETNYTWNCTSIKPGLVLQVDSEAIFLLEGILHCFQVVSVDSYAVLHVLQTGKTSHWKIGVSSCLSCLLWFLLWNLIKISEVKKANHEGRDRREENDKNHRKRDTTIILDTTTRDTAADLERLKDMFTPQTEGDASASSRQHHFPWRRGGQRRQRKQLTGRKRDWKKLWSTSFSSQRRGRRWVFCLFVYD